MALVAIVMGSESDRAVMAATSKVLTEFEVEHTSHVLSAHRTPDALHAFVVEAEEAGYEVIIAAAGGAAALPGVVKSHSRLPVIGVPLASSELHGVDALLSILQMPPRVPVATVAVGDWGARNAGYLAVEILALHHAAIRERYRAFRRRLSESG